MDASEAQPSSQSLAFDLQVGQGGNGLSGVAISWPLAQPATGGVAQEAVAGVLRSHSPCRVWSPALSRGIGSSWAQSRAALISKPLKEPRRCCLPPQVLNKKYMSAVNQKVEAEEAALQAQTDANQLLQLCEFCKSQITTRACILGVPLQPRKYACSTPPC